jgi:hypothetical protein
MGSERRRRRTGAVAAALLAATAASAGWGVSAAEPWWVPLGLRGTAVTAVVPAGRGLIAVAGGAVHCVALPGGPTPPVCTRTLGHPTTAPLWTIERGRVLHRTPGGGQAVDPGSPDLGAGAHLLAAPVALPGEVVAVASDGIVWRRIASGGWGRSLLLLPEGLVAGAPAVTGLAAFETDPLSSSVYLSTDGYAVLISTDGGDDWSRAAPGLPAGVLAIATDAPTRAVYVGTRDGVWVHHLQAIPEPPVYRPQALRTRWLEIAAITAAATLLALLLLARFAGAHPRTRRKQRNDRKS